MCRDVNPPSGWVKNVELFGEGKLISTAFDGTIRLWVRVRVRRCVCGGACA
jgi:hypothetical protein